MPGNRRVVLGAAILTFAGALLSGPAQAEDFKLGGISVLSGPGSAWGIAIKSAMEFVAEDWNSKGGLPIGDKTYQVVPIVYDDAYKPEQAVSAMNRLVFEDKVRFVVGPMAGASVNAVLPIATPNGVLTMSMGFTRESMKPEHPLSFRAVPTTAEYAKPYLSWVAAQTKIKSVVVVGPNDSSGQTTADDAVPVYKAAGVDATFESYERSRTDFTAILTRIISEGIDAIDTDGSPPATAALIIKQARELGFDGVFIHTGGEASAEWIKAIGKEAVEGVYVQIGYNKEDSAVAAIAERFQKKYDMEMSTHVPVMYATTQMLIAAIQKSGAIDNPEAVSKIIQEMGSYDSEIGKLEVTGAQTYGTTRQIVAPIYVGQITDGQIKVMAKCNVESCE